MKLHIGFGTNEEDDQKTLPTVWGESLLVNGDHVSLIQSATVATVQLCNMLSAL